MYFIGPWSNKIGYELKRSDGEENKEGHDDCFASHPVIRELGEGAFNKCFLCFVLDYFLSVYPVRIFGHLTTLQMFRALLLTPWSCKP